MWSNYKNNRSRWFQTKAGDGCRRTVLFSQIFTSSKPSIMQLKPDQIVLSHCGRCESNKLHSIFKKGQFLNMNVFDFVFRLY